MEKSKKTIAAKLEQLNKEIAPFQIMNHRGVFSLYLYEMNKYKSELLAEGRSCCEWDNLFKTFTCDILKDSRFELTTDFESGMLCVYSDELACLKDLGIKFKRECDDKRLFKKPDSRTEFLGDGEKY